MKLNRREFLLASGCAAAGLGWADTSKVRVGLVRCDNRKLAHPASVEDPLDYPRIRDMVWKAIEYGKPRAGSLEAKIRPGSWVVLKPNIAFLPSQESYCQGDVTDFRVLKAVLEYLARKSKARRITVSEGGSYQAVHTKGMWEISQNGVRVDAETLDWGTTDFPGWGGTLGGMLREFSAQFPGKQFDYINLNLDGLRDAAGAHRYVEVRRTARGVGAFAAKSAYCITNTIQNCDFLIDIPVMKVHADCGVTACLKNYVGTAPREVYAPSWRYSNRILHDEYSVEGRVDGWVVDLASFHPADYNIVDGIRGLQYTNHNNRKPDQMVRSNLLLAGEDLVAVDSVVTRIMGFNPWDFEFIHMASQRDMGTMDSGHIEVVGEEADRVTRRWAKNSAWHGRCNRDWKVTANPVAAIDSWKGLTIPTDTLHFARATGTDIPGTTYGAAMHIRAQGSRKGFLWLGVHGRVAVSINGAKVAEQESAEACHVGQFKIPIDLRSGENMVVFQAKGIKDAPQISALMVGPANDGDTVEGIRYLG
jgi:uncharacterized protein (DUF362 family)